MQPLSLIRLFVCFLKIGSLSFGGFMSLVSMIESQVVEKRKWLSSEDMLDGVALASLLPGPMAVNTVAYVGYRLRGGVGAAVSAFAVLLPTALFMLVLTDLYFRFGTLPQMARVFSGILPAVAAIVLSVCLRMALKNLRSFGLWGGFVFAVLVFLLMPREYRIYATFGLVFFYGTVGYFCYVFGRNKRMGGDADAAPVARVGHRQMPVSRWLGFALLGLVVLLGVVPLPVAHDGLVSLMSTFGSMSLTLFGGGYVFIPMIQEIVVERFEWLSAKEFIDGIALGQVTPGPILISASFIGQKVAGIPGALLSTLAIFAPPAVLMVLLTGMLDAIKGSRSVRATMKGIRVAVIALIFCAFVNIFLMAWPGSGGESGEYILVLCVFLSSFVALFRFKVDVIWVVPFAGLLGYFFG
jgi:chromate transporter